MVEEGLFPAPDQKDGSVANDEAGHATDLGFGHSVTVTSAPSVIMQM